MVKKTSLLNIFILCLCLISLTKSQDDEDWIYYDYSTESCEKTYNGNDKSHTFAVEFGTGKIPYYLKVEVNSTDNNPAPLLCFSSRDRTCSDKELLMKNPNGKSVFMWVKREQFEKDDQELYINVQCAEEGCKYKVKVTGEQSAVFEPNFVYSYLVSSSNREMRFDIISAQSSVYMTVTLEGSTKATVSVENQYADQLNHKTGKAMTFWIPGEDEEEEEEEEEEEKTNNKKRLRATNMATINVKSAEVGEYITISVHLVDDNDYERLGVGPKDFLIPNGPEVYGYLEKDELNEECFPLNLADERFRSMNKLYITGRVHTKYAWFFLEDENRNYLEETDVEVLNGQLSFVMNNNGKLNYVCMELPIEESIKINVMSFAISITEPSSLKQLYDYYPPQLTGQIYRRILPKGSIAFFSGTKNDQSAKKYDYNLYEVKGHAKLYIAECREYPDCHYDDIEIFNLIEPKNTNQMTIWTTTEDKSSAIGPGKYVMVVQCIDDDNQGNGYCEFETSIFSKGQPVYMVENEKFSRFALKGEKGTFVADLQSGRQIQRITFDIMIFSGDVNFDLVEDAPTLKANGESIDISYQKYYLSNKIHFYINLAQLSVDEITIEYTATINSFFSIQFNVHPYNLVQTEEIVPSGESYLVQIDPTSPTKAKKVFLENFRYKNKNPYFANFFALNCEFEVKRETNVVNFYDGYAQEIITSSTPGYSSDSYEYNIKITESDLSNYNHKMCMLYVIGFESETDNSRDIVIGENINQQIIFDKDLKKLRFIYPHSDISKDLAVYVNIIDKAYYKINIIAGTINIKSVTVTRSQIFYLRASVISLHCQENRVCPIMLQVEYDKEIIKTSPMIEVTLREIKNTPTYLQKGQAKRDFVCGDRFYYLYTDIGKNEQGDITVNFLREFGNIWAKVVRKDQTSADEEANWRGIYRMPSKEWGDSLPFNAYTKKMQINPEDTQDCIEGCYLLISIQVSQIGEYVEDSKFYPFSILTRITPNNRAYTDIPKVVIQVDEFIIGNVDVSENERIYEFYEVWLPHDAETVEFDWQSSVAGLYINLGGTRPTTKNADFKLLPPGRDSILVLQKSEILEKAKAKKITIPNENSLEDLNLVIGIWTDKCDSIDTELYSLRVHEPDLTDSLDIVIANTDQKILCKPTQISDGEFRCLFMVIYDDDDVDLSTPVLAYGASTSNGATSYMYGNFIDRNLFDEYQTGELRKIIPTFETATINSRKEGIDYIYVSDLEEQKYLYISVITDEPYEVMLVTSMPVYNYLAYDLFEFNPNPSTEQLLACPGDQLRLVFPGKNSVMVNIETLNGYAQLNWKNDPQTVYNLRGAGDRLSLSSGKTLDQLVIRKIESGKSNDMADPGFLFYISFHERNPELNFDEITYGKSLELAYRDSDLPIVLYSKVRNQYNDLNVAITFKDNDIDEGDYYSIPPIFVSAQLTKESLIYAAKKDPDLTPSYDKAIIGHYDTALRTAQIFLSEDMIESYNIKPEDNPTLYITVDKSEELKDDLFAKFTVEAQVSGLNDGVIPVEKVYHYGRLQENSFGYNVYRLRTNKNKPVMRVQIAFNSRYLDFTISDTDESRANITYMNAEKSRGKVTATFKTKEQVEIYYLFIFRRTRSEIDNYLNNYAFNYITAKSEGDFFNYTIFRSPEIEYQESKEDDYDVIKCTFNKIDVEPGYANITYFFKVVDNKTHYYGEEINTVAITESPFFTIYKRNPVDEDGKITLIAKSFDLANWVYLNVIAQIQKDNVVEFVAYNGKTLVRPAPEGSSSGSGGDNTTLFIVVGVILLVIVIGLVVTIFLFQMRNKSLLNQVKAVSFQKTNSNTDPNLLLQQSQQETK